MSHLMGVELGTQSLDRFEALADVQELEGLREIARTTRERLHGRVFWNVNTTAVGGGVAEMLQPLVRYARGAGIDARWHVIRGNPEFFRLTKRLHHALHGSTGDGSPLGPVERAVYESTLRENARELALCVKPGDVMLLHDPQTLGLSHAFAERGAHVVWRSHIGADASNEEVEQAWQFLAPYLEPVQACVFSREDYVPEVCRSRPIRIIRPSIDAFSPKNCDLDEDTIRTVLVHVGLVEGPPPSPPRHEFMRIDGSPGRVDSRADIVRFGRPPAWTDPLVVQVSRWDPLKDPVGVMQAFREVVDAPPYAQAHLVLAGPDVRGVTDDPEGARTLDAVIEAWRGLPGHVRDRVHLASLPVEDVQENAVIVNALQRHATVVVQKSLKEGFGLTVTEAMWKGRPVVASAVGGIRDQIEDGVSGLLLQDPADPQGLAAALQRLLADPEERERLAVAGRERVRTKFLGVRHLFEYASLLEDLGV